MKVCNKCNCEYDEDLNFCSKCGSELVLKPKVLFCASCGKLLGENADKFCPYCGYQIVQTSKSVSEQISGIAKKLKLPKITLPTSNSHNSNNVEQSSFNNESTAKDNQTNDAANNTVAIEEKHFSVKEMLSRLFMFDGCIGRLEYFILAIISDVVGIGIQLYWQTSLEGLILQSSGGVMSSPGMAFVLIISLVTAVIKFAAITKRVHDLGKGGWWAFTACLMSRNILFEVFLILFLSIKKGKQGYNEYAD